MRTLSRVFLIGLMAAFGAPRAQAQVPPYGTDPHRYQVERHQARMDRLRSQADARADTARRFETDARLTLRDLEAARRPPTPYVDYAPPPADPDASAARHRRTRETVTQIDAWLDRAPD